jgi:hypothetical protein
LIITTVIDQCIYKLTAALTFFLTNLKMEEVYYLNWASIGVEPLLEELSKELLVQTVNSIVEGQKDKLGDILWLVAAGNVGSATVAIRQATITWITAFGLLLPVDAHGHKREQSQSADEV